jgi:protocatechuate 3,4-dioxygenase beta subunit
MGDFVRERREAILLLSAAGAAFALGCSGSSPTSPTPVAQASGSPAPAPGTGTGSANATCSVSPNETVGPYPSLQDLIRSDIREDRQGTALQLTITVVNVAAGCAPMPNVAVEIWQCDVAGAYSQYGSQAARTFLRGIQVTNAAGEATFTTIYPGWYQGRATHIHVEVASAGRSLKVTQIAFPEEISNQVHTQGVYASRGVNATTNARDNVFSDGVSNQLATVAGSPATGMTATYRLGVSG